MTPKRPYRTLDLVLVIAFSCFSVTSLLFDIQTALDIRLSADSNLLVRAYQWFARTADPILLDPPIYFRLMCAISAFVYGPFYLLLVVAFVKRQEWIRLPAIVFASTILYSMVIVLGEALFGTVQPTNWPIFLAAYTPYAAIPLLLLWRVRRAPLFS